jgi:hypothetical protein
MEGEPERTLLWGKSGRDIEPGAPGRVRLKIEKSSEKRGQVVCKRCLRRIEVQTEVSTDPLFDERFKCIFTLFAFSDLQKLRARSSTGVCEQMLAGQEA